MGLVYSFIQLSNPLKPELKEIEVKCLVDRDSTFLCIPQHLAIQLGIKELETREATLANGNNVLVPYGGPVKVGFENRNCFVGTLIFGNEVLLGAMPMEDMDLVIHPKLYNLSVNPDSPTIPRASVK